MDFLNDLNEVQREAVENIDGPSLVIAGAGSGKTRVLTYRIAYMLSSNISPNSILALTFTNKAAKEMKDRIASIVGMHNAHNIWMGTFHSIFARILRIESEYLGFDSNFTIYDTQDSRNLLKTIIKEMKLDEKVYKPADVQKRISTAKNNLVTPQMYSNNKDILYADSIAGMPLLSDIYRRYFARCKNSNSMDFDDLLLYANILFKHNKEAVKKYQAKFRYVLVDEYQDTNFAQYLIIKRISEDNKNLCVVGDDAQSIYSFRGARIENILNFRNDYPEYKIFKLEQNYRSTKTIVDAANSVIQKNKNQIQKNTFSENEDGDKIEVIRALTDHEEGYIVANSIYDTRLSKSLQPSDFAILYRTNAQSRIFEESLRKLNLPYKIYGGLSFYQRKEIKDLIAYLRVVVNPHDEEAIKRIINFPKRGIGATSLSKLIQNSINKDESIWDSIVNIHNNNCGLKPAAIKKISGFGELMENFMSKYKTESAYELANHIAIKTGIIKEFSLDKTPEGISRNENLQELLNGIKEFTDIAEESGNDNYIENYLEEIALVSDMDNEDEEDRNKISLMTIHSSKGLEFKYLYLVGMEENLFPSKMTMTSEKELEEERRLFYVALTRAEKKACLTFAKTRFKYGEMSYPSPSRFITEIDQQYVYYANESVFKTKFSGSVSSDNTYEEKSEEKSFTQKKTRLPKPKLLPRKQSSDLKKFIYSNPDEIQQGMQVEHQRFGLGKVVGIEGVSPNRKATVFFQHIGKKELLLKFAKLKIVR
ncbi:MAG: UvrD-helicase domain-containing protein [Marinifilaceae bacterium]|jgi:DNA helicase-2/ATP-dependent DNA helicase PcrA|nr:UvrD-helicase domain-containing protein [Marinifilaceae bacterium]